MYRIAAVLICIFALPTYAQSESDGCTASCGTPQSGQILVDIKNHCMCVDAASNNKCFLIDTGGSAHPTYQGQGNLHDAEGAKYQTKKGVAEDSYDNDAIATGISGDDHAGMWIHKAGDNGGTDTTLGCMAVPVKDWKTVKEAYNKKEVTKVDVCNGRESNGWTNTVNRINSAEGEVPQAPKPAPKGSGNATP